MSSLISGPVYVGFALAQAGDDPAVLAARARYRARMAVNNALAYRREALGGPWVDPDLCGPPAPTHAQQWLAVAEAEMAAAEQHDRRAATDRSA